MNYLVIAYQPTAAILNVLEEHGESLATWDVENGEEHVYELTDSGKEALTSPGETRDEIYTEMVSHQPTVSVVSVLNGRKEQRRHAVQTDTPVDERHYFNDLLPDHESVADVLTTASPGGDARKYCVFTKFERFSLRFDCRRPYKTLITGLQPLNKKCVTDLIDGGYIDPSHADRQLRVYPDSEQLLEWADRVDEKWGLDCGFVGDVTVRNGEVTVGFDGFTIHGVDETVKEWCDERWGDPDSAESTDVTKPFMRPDEYGLYSREDSVVSEPVIRMWWD